MKFRSLALIAGAMLCGLGATAGNEVARAASEVSDTVAIQRARAVRVKARAEKAHYPNQWNLDALPSYRPERQVSGTLRIYGSNYYTDGPLDNYIEEGFREHHPNVRFEYSTPTALVAMPALYFGLADIGISRKITFDENLAFQRIKGYHPLQITLATGSYNVPGWNPALGIFVHKDNPLARLTLDQVDAIFGAERTGAFDIDNGWAWRTDRARGAKENIRTWGQLGLQGKWANQPINVYGLTLKYHQQMVIERRAFDGGSKWNEKLREYSHVTRPDGSTGTSNAALLDDLGRDPFGIAYSNMGYVTAEHNVRVLPLAAKAAGPYVDLTIENIRDRSYPLYDEHYLYVDRRPGETLDPAVREFVRYVLSREGQAAIMKDGKWLPLTGDVVREQRRKLD